MADISPQTIVEQTARCHSSPPCGGTACAPDSPREFYSSKQLVEAYSVQRSAEVFFRGDSIKKTSNDRSYVQPVSVKVDSERHDDIDWRFNLNNSTVDIIKRNPSREFWVISIDATITKQFIDKDGVSHDFHPSETMYVMNAKAISRLKELERTKQIVNGYEGEF